MPYLPALITPTRYSNPAAGVTIDDLSKLILKYIASRTERPTDAVAARVSAT